MNKKNYDLIIIGAGPGGYIAAIRAGQQGLKTALIEKDSMGGMCLNRGCIPSKSLLKSARLYQEIKGAENFGICGIKPEDIKPDWKKMNARAEKIVSQFKKGISTLLKHNRVEIISGRAEVLDRETLEVAKDKYNFKNLIIGTGSLYAIPDYMAKVANVYSPENIYNIEQLPASIAIVGAGVIGVEFAFLFSLLGVKVTLVEKQSELIPFMDQDLCTFLRRQLKKRKIKLLLNAEVKAFKDGLRYTDLLQNMTTPMKADAYLFALPRKANLNGIESLIAAGLELENRGFIKTDLRCRTTLPGIYAVGDVNGKFMLAHVAAAEGSCAADTICGKGKDLVYDLMPYNLYSHPEIASIGLTEKAALAKGFLVETGKFPFAANGKALADGTSEGFVKIINEKKYGEILGVHIVAANATDLIGEAGLALQMEATVQELALLTHPHPTFVEAIMEASFKSAGTPLHSL
ncbi:dihydrolipoyl dehydrogenase [Candidatus Riflebacteria bacterium]